MFNTGKEGEQIPGVAAFLNCFVSLGVHRQHYDFDGLLFSQLPQPATPAQGTFATLVAVTYDQSNRGRS